MRSGYKSRVSYKIQIKDVDICDSKSNNPQSHERFRARKHDTNWYCLANEIVKRMSVYMNFLIIFSFLLHNSSTDWDQTSKDVFSWLRDGLAKIIRIFLPIC